MTVLLAAAAFLLLVGSFLVVRTLIEIDADASAAHHRHRVHRPAAPDQRRAA